MKHDELVEIGYKWLLNKCGFAFKELRAYTYPGERPDIIGFNSVGSFVLEAKTSLADMQRDRGKFFRKYPFEGMGDWRFFIAEKGLLTTYKLPKGWGLIEVNKNKKARTVYNPFGIGNIYSKWNRNPKNQKAELLMLYSALRRLHNKGLLTKENFKE